MLPIPMAADVDMSLSWLLYLLLALFLLTIIVGALAARRAGGGEASDVPHADSRPLRENRKLPNRKRRAR